MGTEHIVGAMMRHGVRRLVCQTAWEAGLAGSLFMKMLVPLFLLGTTTQTKERQEEIIRTSSSDLLEIG